MTDVVVVSAVRTAVGKFQGGLSSLSATALGAVVVREAVRRAGVQPEQVNECVMGCVLPAGLGQNPARQAALKGGLADTVAALTINMVCGSGLRAVMLGAQSIMAGDAEIVVAGGMESMSNAPYLLPGARNGYRMGDSKLVDSMVKDGLWCACDDQHMGMTGELVAEKHSISREQQDAYAVESHRRAAAAWLDGRFKVEVVPVEVPGKKGGVTLFDRDESIREDTSLESLQRLRAAFKEGGTVTAGNAPRRERCCRGSDLDVSLEGRSVRLEAARKDQGSSHERRRPQVGHAPRRSSASVRFSKKPAGPPKKSTCLSSTKPSACRRSASPGSFSLELTKVNVNGGAVAIGHPIGASGARVLVTLIHEMIRRDANKGVAALCLGGGNSVALAVER